MKRTTIHTDNPLIGEFMGQEVTRKGRKFKRYLPPYGYCKIHPDYMKYHLSWDWLMPVVEKCLIGEAENSNDTLIKNIYDGLTEIDIASTHIAVVEYIKWYNRHKFEIFKELCNNK